MNYKLRIHVPNMNFRKFIAWENQIVPYQNLFIIRFLRSDEEDVMRAAQIILKDKDFFMYDDIPKDLYDLRGLDQLW